MAVTGLALPQGVRRDKKSDARKLLLSVQKDKKQGTGEIHRIC